MLDPGSLLIWLRALLVIRRNHQVFGLGGFTDLGGANEKVFSFLRSSTDADGTRMSVLCINNLSPEPQHVTLDLSPFAGLIPYDLLRDDDHDMIGDGPFEVEVAGHGFLWLRIMANDPDLPPPDPGPEIAASTTVEEDDLAVADPVAATS